MEVTVESLDIEQTFHEGKTEPSMHPVVVMERLPCARPYTGTEFTVTNKDCRGNYRVSLNMYLKMLPSRAWTQMLHYLALVQLFELEHFVLKDPYHM